MKVFKIVLVLLMVAMALAPVSLNAATPSTYRVIDRWPTPTWHLSKPSGLAIDAAGNTYVADTDNNCVRKYGPDRVLVGVWGSLGTGDGQFNKPNDVAVYDGHVYVVDTGNHRVQKLTTQGGFVARWGSAGGPDMSGSGDGEFKDPRSIAVDGLGNVYVADTGNNRVQKFTAEGVFSLKWGTPGSSEGQFYKPTGIAIESSGAVFVADSENHRIQEFDSSGQFVNAWGERGTLTDPSPAKFRGKPTGVAADSMGHVYVSDSASLSADRIYKFTRDGEYVARWGAAATSTAGCIHPRGSHAMPRATCGSPTP